METAARLRLQGMAMLAVSLGVGVLAGVAGERLRSAASTPEPPFERFDRFNRGGGGRGGGGGLPPPFQQLGLSDEQREQIAAVMESRRARTESLMQELLTPLAAEMDSVRSAIAEILTPAQLADLNAAFDSSGPLRGFGGMRRGGRCGRRRFGPPRDRQR